MVVLSVGMKIIPRVVELAEAIWAWISTNTILPYRPISAGQHLNGRVSMSAAFFRDPKDIPEFGHRGQRCRLRRGHDLERGTRDTESIEIPCPMKWT